MSSKVKGPIQKSLSLNLGRCPAGPAAAASTEQMESHRQYSELELYVGNGG